jgi:hypothetical protein
MEWENIYEDLGNMTVTKDGTVGIDDGVDSSTYVIPVGSKICLVPGGIDETDVLINKLINPTTTEDMQLVEKCFFTTTRPWKIGINLLCKIVDLAQETQAYSYPNYTIFSAFFEHGSECFHGRVSRCGEYYFLHYN